MNNLIVAAPTTLIAWGGSGILIGASAQSNTNGAFNTASIVDCLTNGTGSAGCTGSNIDISTYAAGLCSSYQVDSQCNTTCQPENACYDDWFLAARDQLNCLYDNRMAIGGFINARYWSSNENTSSLAWLQNFSDGAQDGGFGKVSSLRVRCVQAFPP